MKYRLLIGLSLGLMLLPRLHGLTSPQLRDNPTVPATPEPRYRLTQQALDSQRSVGARLYTYPKILTGNRPQAMGVADLNRDGVLDLVTANEFSGSPSNNGDVSVHLGAGDGTFETPPPFVPPVLFPTSGSANDMALADVDGNGQVDVITANMSSDDISLLPGLGNGAFLAPPAIIPVADLDIADLNHDSIPDIVSVADGLNAEAVWVLLGVGDGTFGLQHYPLALNNRPTWVESIDLNGDGHLDIVTVNEGISDVVVLIGLGNGMFQPPQFTDIGAADILATSTDLNRDGRPDLVLTSDRSGDIRVLLGTGAGTFQAQKRFDLAGFDIRALRVADLNRDGNPDVITASRGDDEVSVLLGNGDGTLQPQQRFAVGDQPQFLKIIGLDQNGALDIAVANKSFSISVLLGVGDGTLQPEKRFPVEAEPFARVAQPVWLEAADLNADGLLDIVTVNDGSNDVSVLLGDGRGEFALSHSTPVGVNPISGAIADLATRTP